MVTDGVNSLVIVEVGMDVVVIVVGCLAVLVMDTVVLVVVAVAVCVGRPVLVVSQEISCHSQQFTLIS